MKARIPWLRAIGVCSVALLVLNGVASLSGFAVGYRRLKIENGVAVFATGFVLFNLSEVDFSAVASRMSFKSPAETMTYDFIKAEDIQPGLLFRFYGCHFNDEYRQLRGWNLIRISGGMEDPFVWFGTDPEFQRLYYLRCFNRIVPVLLELLLLLPVPAAYVFFTLRNIRRLRRQGQCVRCGYDLRATPDRCLECGVSHQPTTR